MKTIEVDEIYTVTSQVKPNTSVKVHQTFYVVFFDEQNQPSNVASRTKEL